MVTHVDQYEGFCYIDDGSKLQDGSGFTGVRVALDVLPIPDVGAVAAVTGCCGAIDVFGRCARYLRPRDGRDAQFDLVTNWQLRNAGFEDATYAPWTLLGTGGVLVRTSGWNSIAAHSGNRFLGASGTKATYSGYLRQCAYAPAGSYRACVWSIISHKLTTDPEIAKNRIGVDPTGGIDPAAASVLWSDWDTTTGTVTTPWREISTPVFVSSGSPCTVFLQYVQTDPTTNHINCFDDAELVAD